MKGLSSSWTKKQSVPTIKSALMSFWMISGWISIFSQCTSCSAVVKRTAYLKGLLALQDQTLLSRSRGHLQNCFGNVTLLPSRLHAWSARKKSWSQSQTCAGRLVFTSVPDCDIEVPWFVLWCTSGQCHREENLQSQLQREKPLGTYSSLFFNPHPR